MTVMKGTMIFGNSSGNSRSESLVSSDRTDTVGSMLAKMRQLIPLRMALSYGFTDSDDKNLPIGGAPTASNGLKMLYLRVEDELIRRDGQLTTVNTPGSYVPPASTPARARGNWPMDWCVMSQWYPQNNTPTGVWALQYTCGIPMDATSYDSSPDADLTSGWLTRWNAYITGVRTASLGFSSFAAIQRGTTPPPYNIPAKPVQVSYNAITERYQFDMPATWTPPANVGQVNTYTASIRGMVALNFLNGQRPVVYAPAQGATSPSLTMARGRYPQVAWDQSGTVCLVNHVGVRVGTVNILGQRRRKTGRIPFVSRGRARVSRP